MLDDLKLLMSDFRRSRLAGLPVDIEPILDALDKTDLENDLKDLEADRDSVKKEIQELENELEDLEAEKSELTSDIADLKSQLSDLED